MKKVFFYFDGFNFYNGLKDGNHYQYYWIDIVKLSKLLISKIKESEIETVYYFSALPTWNEAKTKRHKKFYAVNQKLNPGVFKVVSGKFSKKRINCLASCKEEFFKHEEKQTDVNIAIQMVNDAQQGLCDIMCLVTGDNDMIPPIELIRNLFPEIEIQVFSPPCRSNNQLKNFAHKSRNLGSMLNLFAQAILPDEVDAGGWTHYIPLKWKSKM